MVGQRGRAFAYGTVTVSVFVVAAVLGWRMLPGVAVGDIDPMGAVLGLTALAISVWTGGLTVRSLRWQETSLTEMAERLAVEVLHGERDARLQLLGGHGKTIDVRFVLHPAPNHNAEGAGSEGRLEEVVDYYRRLQPQRMVITGAPGAGKTVLAVQLMLRLLERRGPEDPVPVRLSLASWDTDRSVEDWIAHHLTDAYRLPAAAADMLVKARQVLPVLDGLDEMDPDPEPGYGSRAVQAVRALNFYQHAVDKAALVLTCRSETHLALDALRVWAHDSARVEVCPVDEGTACQFLTDGVGDPVRWREVRDSLEQDPYGPLATGLSTPWRLTLAVTVYEERDPVDGTYHRDPRTLLSSALNSPDAVRDHLLDLFIPAAIARRPGPCGAFYTPGQVRAWLSTLASYLEHNSATDRRVGGRRLSGTDIVLHELWPLAGSWLPRVATATGLTVMRLTFAALIIHHFRLNLFASGIVAVFSALWVYATWVDWPEPRRVDLGRLRTSAGRRSFAGELVFWLVSGLGMALVVGLQAGLVIGLVIGLVSGVAYGIKAPGTLGVVDPKDIVRNDLVVGLAVGLVLGLYTGLALGLQLGLAVGLAFGPRYGLAGLRYAALLL